MEREYHLYSSEYCTLVQFCIRLNFFVVFSFCVHSKIVSTLSPLEACESIWIRIRIRIWIQCIFIRNSIFQWMMIIFVIVDFTIYSRHFNRDYIILDLRFQTNNYHTNSNDIAITSNRSIFIVSTAFNFNWTIFFLTWFCEIEEEVFILNPIDKIDERHPFYLIHSFWKGENRERNTTETIAKVVVANM